MREQIKDDKIVIRVNNEFKKHYWYIEELKQDTGFEPEYSFEQGIKETISWYRNNR